MSRISIVKTTVGTLLIHARGLFQRDKYMVFDNEPSTIYRWVKNQWKPTCPTMGKMLEIVDAF